jgi:hypothetical protein
MKKKILAAALFICTCSYASLAGNISDAVKRAKQSFEKEYPGALYARWEAMDNEAVFSVRFVYNNLSMVAYYDEAGSSVGCASIITVSNLPAPVQQKIASLFHAEEIVSVQQLQTGSDMMYYLEVEKNGQRLFFQVSGAGSIKAAIKKAVKN